MLPFKLFNYRETVFNQKFTVTGFCVQTGVLLNDFNKYRRTVASEYMYMRYCDTFLMAAKRK